MGFDRRNVLTFILGGAAGTMVTPIPWKMIDDVAIWTQNWPWIPRNIEGADEYVKTTSKLCPSGCGMKVRLVGGSPVRVVGDEDHPLSGGTLTALAAAEVDALYSPSRVKRPLRKTADGTHVAISWGEATRILEEKLGAARGYGKLAVVTGDENGSMAELLSAFTAKAGSSKFCLMPSEATTATTAWQGQMGGSGQLGYDIDNADYVLALGADILESWGPVVRTRRAYAAARPHGEEPKTTYVYAGPQATNTAVGSDEWVPAKPGAQAALALSIAHVLVKNGAVIYEAADFDAFRDFVLGSCSPQQTAAMTGVAPAKVEALAKALMGASRPVVVTGSEIGAGGSAAAVMAGAAVNLLLGRLNKPGGMTVLADAPTVLPAAMSAAERAKGDAVAFFAEIAAGQGTLPEALIIHAANPVYSLPGSAEVEAALAKIPFTVTFATNLDETAKLADLVLPVPQTLERLDDVYTPYGSGKAVYSLAVPVMEPMYDAMHPGDFLLTLSARLGADLGAGSYQELIEAKAAAIGADASSLADGEAWTSDALEEQYGLSLNPAQLKASVAAMKPAELMLAPMRKLCTGTDVSAMPPHNNKTVRKDELTPEAMFVRLNSATAQAVGVSGGQMVVLSSPAGSVRAKVRIDEGVMTGCVAALMGLGHTAFDAYSQNNGDNVAKVLAATKEPGTELPVFTGVSVTLAKA